MEYEVAFLGWKALPEITHSIYMMGTFHLFMLLELSLEATARECSGMVENK